MRCGIDARLLSLAGVARYIRCLVQGLDVAGLPHEFVIYATPEQLASLDVKNLRLVPVSWRPFSVADQYRWSGQVRRDGLDVIHFPQYGQPLVLPCKQVLTLHDLLFYHYSIGGSWLRPVRRLYYNLQHQLARWKADHIISVSHATAADLQKILKIPGDRISVVHNAADPLFHITAPAEHRAVAAKYDLPPRFFLYVGTNKPWKNLPMLLKAFVQAQRRLPEVRLVIAGKQGRVQVPMPELIRSFGAEGVQFLGEMPEDDMPPLYGAATALLFPSSYEGFGYPPLEAMACGTPVLAAKAASIPEVVGDAGILLSPLDAEGWADGLVKIWNDPKLEAQLRAVGPLRAEMFTQSRMIAETVAVYETAAGSSKCVADLTTSTA